MKRAWKPLDVGGLRLYKVVVTYPPSRNRRHGVRMEYIVASDSPSGAAAIYEHDCMGEIPVEDRPSVRGYALTILQPESWWINGVPCEHPETGRAGRGDTGPK